MDAGENRWMPPRPTRSDPGDSPGRLRSGADGDPDASSPTNRSLDPANRASRTGPATRARRRTSPGRRIAAVYLALAVVTALVVTVGAASQPVYGSLAPYRQVHFADLRNTPRPVGWSLDLAKIFAPTAPAQCLSFRSEAIDSRHEVVTATLPTSSSTGQNAECEVSSPTTEGLVMMLDPETGRVLWTRDLFRDLHTTVFSLVVHASVSAGAVVVGIDGSAGDVLLALAVGDGHTISSGAIDRVDEVINFAVSGSLVLSVVPDSNGTVETYSLRRIDSLDTLLWRRALSAATFPEFLPDRVIVPLLSGTIQVDGKTGRESDWGASLASAKSVRVTGSQILATLVPVGVGLQSYVVLFDKTGKSVWSHEAASVSALVVSRTCVMMSTGATTVTCLDRATGKTRWAISQPGAPSGTPLGATTDDVPVTAPIQPTDTSLTMSELDGSTGRIRFMATVPRGAVVVGHGLATGYTLDTSPQDGRDRVTAFDLDDGRILWALRADDLTVWGGQFIQISHEAVARQLLDGPGADRHDMLTG